MKKLNEVICGIGAWALLIVSILLMVVAFGGLFYGLTTHNPDAGMGFAFFLAGPTAARAVLGISNWLGNIADGRDDYEWD